MLRDLQPGTEAELVKVCIHILTLADCLAVVPLSLIPRPLSALSLRSLTWYSFAIEKRDSVAFSMRCVCVCVESMRAAHAAQGAALRVLNPKAKQTLVHEAALRIRLSININWQPDSQVTQIGNCHSFAPSTVARARAGGNPGNSAGAQGGGGAPFCCGRTGVYSKQTQ